MDCSVFPKLVSIGLDTEYYENMSTAFQNEGHLSFVVLKGALRKCNFLKHITAKLLIYRY